jgi:hypothetical protein
MRNEKGEALARFQYANTRRALAEIRETGDIDTYSSLVRDYHRAINSINGQPARGMIRLDVYTNAMIYAFGDGWGFVYRGWISPEAQTKRAA